MFKTSKSRPLRRPTGLLLDLEDEHEGNIENDEEYWNIPRNIDRSSGSD